MKRMTPQDRYNWILKYYEEFSNNGWLDILNRDFVDNYVVSTNAKYSVMIYGANKCPQLGLDLANMVKLGMIKRNRLGIDGMSGMGFPKWVWAYHNRKDW